MPNFFDKYDGGDTTTAGSAPPTPSPSPASSGNFFDRYDNPSISSAPFAAKPVADEFQRAASIGTIARASLAPAVQDQIKRFATARGIPVERYGVINGNIVYADENGNYVREIPSVGGGPDVLSKFMRLGDWMAGGTGPALPQIAAGTTGALMGPTGASIPAAAGAAAATDTARQALDKWLAGEPISGVSLGYEPNKIDIANVGGQALLGGGGQLGGSLAARALNRNPLAISAWDRLQALDPNLQRTTSDIQAEAQRRGIDLSAGQATGLRSLMANERQLARTPEAQDLLYDFRNAQRTEQIPPAVNAELSNIAPPQGAQKAIGGFRDAAQAVVDQANAARRASAQRLYDQAFQANQSMTSPAIDSILQKPTGQKALALAQRKMEDQGIPPGNPASLQTLDYVKRALGDIESSAINSGSKDDARIFGGLRRDLTTELDRLDVTARDSQGNPIPGGGLYAQARGAYGAGSDALEEILNGGTGYLNNMTGLDRQAVVNRVFGGGNVLPEDIAKMRAQFALAGKLDDWNGGLRQFLSDRLSDALKPTVTGEVGNVPGKFVQSVWTGQQRQAVEAAIGDPAKVDGFDKLMQVLRAASRSLPEGSPTATDLPAILKGTPQTFGKGAQFLAHALSPETYLNFGTEAMKGLDALRLPAARIRLASALLDGDYAKQLLQLRMLSPTSQKAMQIGGQILSGSILSATGLRHMADQPDFLPPISASATPQSPLAGISGSQ